MMDSSHTLYLVALCLNNELIRIKVSMLLSIKDRGTVLDSKLSPEPKLKEACLSKLN